MTEPDDRPGSDDPEDPSELLRLIGRTVPRSPHADAHRTSAAEAVASDEHDEGPGSDEGDSAQPDEDAEPAQSRHAPSGPVEVGTPPRDESVGPAAGAAERSGNGAGRAVEQSEAGAGTEPAEVEVAGTEQAGSHPARTAVAGPLTPGLVGAGQAGGGEPAEDGPGAAESAPGAAIPPSDTAGAGAGVPAPDASTADDPVPDVRDPDAPTAEGRAPGDPMAIAAVPDDSEAAAADGAGEAVERIDARDDDTERDLDSDTERERAGDTECEPAGDTEREPAEDSEREQAEDTEQEPAGDTELELAEDTELELALEALLLVVDSPIDEASLASTLDQTPSRIRQTLNRMSLAYTADRRGIDLRRAGGGWRFYTRDRYAPYVEKLLLDGQRARLTRAALETLAVVAYRQPVTRARVSAVRGVNCDGVLRTLLTRGLVEEAGTEEQTGGTLFRTTELFLERLGLSSVQELPPLAPLLPDIDAIDDLDGI